jgi:hypothetical protein
VVAVVAKAEEVNEREMTMMMHLMRKAATKATETPMRASMFVRLSGVRGKGAVT